MLNAIKETKDGVLVVRLVGVVDELTDFDKGIGTVPSEVHFICRDVARMNSFGVRNWVKYFQTLKAQGVKMKFLECSSIIVQQMNSVTNLIPTGATLESICLPYLCTKCKAQLVSIANVDDLKRKHFKVPELTCTRCSGLAVFDDIESEYFAAVKSR